MSRVLIFGGTGPSGRALVERLLRRGDQVTIAHTGQHEAEFSVPVAHRHGDITSPTGPAELIGVDSFDLCVATSGRLSAIVDAVRGHVGKLVAVTGLPAYAGIQRVDGAWQMPAGMTELPMPLREDRTPPAIRRTTRADRFTARVQEGERAVLDAHASGDYEGCVLRYTMVYGPHSYKPFEWYFVRRALERRPRLVLEADGLMLPQRGYADNLAHAIVLAAETPAAGGQVFNVGDEDVLSVRAIAELVGVELGHEWDIVSVPMRLSPCGNPFTLRQNTIFDLAKARDLLGYRDVLTAAEATRRTAAWLRDNRPAAGSPEELSIGARAFDYAAEDRVLAACDTFMRASEPAAIERAGAQ